jgi:hypothetical protein
MALTCTPQALSDATSCFSCLNPIQHLQIQTYLLASIAGVSTDPNTLQRLANGFQGLNPVQLQQIQVYLLCAIANAEGA